jgi:Ca2+-binding RTX toxin-like protein
MHPDGTDLTQILLTNEPDPDLSWRPRCNIRGTRGGDTLSGNYRAGAHVRLRRQRHRLRLPANDAVFAGEGNDRVYGGRGRDVLAGGAGSDRLVGGPGRDFLSAQDGIPGNDVLLGGADDDVCVADPGDIAIGC